MLFPGCLISYFQSKGIFTWDRLIKSWASSSPIWMDEEDLSLSPSMRPVWSSAIQNFSSKDVHRFGNKDELVWALSKLSQPIRVKDIYNAMTACLPAGSDPIYPHSLWKVTCPLKMILFSWLVFSNKNLSWEVLQKKGWNGPSKCSMCLSDLESNVHMFFQCASTLQIWYALSLSFCFPHRVFASVQEGYTWWSGQCPSLRSMFVLVVWILWKWKNDRIFQDSKSPLESILLRVLELSNCRVRLMILSFKLFR